MLYETRAHTRAHSWLVTALAVGVREQLQKIESVDTIPVVARARARVVDEGLRITSLVFRVAAVGLTK